MMREIRCRTETNEIISATVFLNVIIGIVTVDLQIKRENRRYAVFFSTLFFSLLLLLLTPPHFCFYSHSFLNSILPTEYRDLTIEQKYFEANPSVGTFINWPLYGDLVSPNAVPLAMRESLARNLPSWQKDDLPKKLQEVNKMFQTSKRKKVKE
jgi:hypothetical protein